MAPNVLELLWELVYRSNGSLRPAVVHRWLDLYFRSSVAGAQFGSKALSIVLELQDRQLLAKWSAHPGSCESIGFETELVQLLAKKHPLSLDFYQISKKHCFLSKEAMDTLFDYFCLVNPDLNALLLLYSDMTIMNGSLESDVYLTKALRTCLDLGEFEKGFQLLRTNPKSLRNPEVYSTILKICTVYDQAKGLRALGKLISKGSFDLERGSLDNLVDHLLRLEELEIASRLIIKFHLHEKVSKILSLLMFRNSKLTIELLSMFPKVPVGAAILRAIMIHLNDQDSVEIEAVRWLLNHDDSLEVPYSLQEKVLNVALHYRDDKLIVRALKNRDYTNYTFERIEEAFREDCRLSLVKFFLENGRKLPESWQKTIRIEIETLPLPRAFAMLIVLRKHGCTVESLVPVLGERLCHMKFGKEFEWKHLRLARRLFRKGWISSQALLQLHESAKESIAVMIHDRDVDGSSLIKNAALLSVPLPFRDLAPHLHNYSFATMYSLYIHFPKMQQYTRFLRAMLISALPTQNLELCQDLIRKLYGLGSLNYAWCIRFLNSRKSRTQRKLFYELVNRVTSFEDGREWIELGFEVRKSFDSRAAREFQKKIVH
jgi:hypothetical protein